MMFSVGMPIKCNLIPIKSMPLLTLTYTFVILALQRNSLTATRVKNLWAGH